MMFDYVLTCKDGYVQGAYRCMLIGLSALMLPRGNVWKRLGLS